MCIVAVDVCGLSRGDPGRGAVGARRTVMVGWVEPCILGGVLGNVLLFDDILGSAVWEAGSWASRAWWWGSRAWAASWW